MSAAKKRQSRRLAAEREIDQVLTSGVSPVERGSFG